MKFIDLCGNSEFEYRIDWVISSQFFKDALQADKVSLNVWNKENYFQSYKIRKFLLIKYLQGIIFYWK